MTSAQVSLAWLLGRPGVSSLVVGAKTEQQLLDNLAAADITLTETERGRLDEVSAPPLIYPYWHHAKSASDRLGPHDIVPNEALRNSRA
jgi:diketogulonate reductase-like aldo/keto reductase